ncbi:MAG: peptide deformylase [Firmicutes bacterium]|nr:peptide deformylase [Bacillota bacterium]
MAIRRIRTEGDKVLRQKAQKVNNISPPVLKLLDDMKETLEDADGLGLAAPQVGISKAILVARAGDNILELLNPVIIKSKGEETAVEGCLSIPGIYGEVPRAVEVEVTAMDREGKQISIKARDLLARILQHEIDHLHGVLFVDKATRFIPQDEL